MNRDAMNSTKPHVALEAAFTVLDAAQSLPPHLRVLGVTLLFLLLCERLGLDKSEMLHKASRMSADGDSHYFNHLRAMHDYIDNELKA